jgi:hypothetical protein
MTEFQPETVTGTVTDDSSESSGGKISSPVENRHTTKSVQQQQPISVQEKAAPTVVVRRLETSENEEGKKEKATASTATGEKDEKEKEKEKVDPEKQKKDRAERYNRRLSKRGVEGPEEEDDLTNCIAKKMASFAQMMLMP